MGHGHGEPFEVPHYSKFSNWEKCPELVEHQQRLARLGLNDPWIRNLTAAYDPKTGLQQSHWTVVKNVMRHGLKPGIILAGTFIALDEAYNLYKKGHTSWGH